MFPGFITIYRDEDKYINLYFYPGFNKNFSSIYKPLELTDEFEYIKNINEDDSIIYKFINKRIKKIKCKLITFNNEEKEIILSI